MLKICSSGYWLKVLSIHYRFQNDNAISEKIYENDYKIYQNRKIFNKVFTLNKGYNPFNATNASKHLTEDPIRKKNFIN